MARFTDEEIEKLQEIISSIPDYFDDVDEIQCPHCGEIQHQLESSDPSLYDQDTHLHTCGNCERKYTLSSNMSFSWSTEAKEYV